MGVGYRPRRRMWLIGFRCIRWVSHARTVHPAAGRPAGAAVACSHARRAAASLRGPAPEAAPPAETGRFTTSTEPATANGGGVYPARVCAHDRIPPVATPPLRALHGWRFNVAADTRSGTLTRR